MEGRYFNEEKYLGKRPPPPPLPEYDPKEEPTKWDRARLRYNLPVEKTKEWTPIGTHPENPDDPDWRGVIRNNVIEYEMPKKYPYGQPVPEHYFWFDTPDYADPFKKLWYSFKWFATTGTAFALWRSALEGQSFIWSTNRRLLATIVIPWTAAGLGASTAVLVASNLRGKKDDQYNYALGGLVFGTMMGHSHYVRWIRWTTFAVPAALIFKYNAETNGLLKPSGNFRCINIGITGNDAEHGLKSGDMRFGLKTSHGDPGRDQRVMH